MFYSDLGSASNWWFCEGNLLQPIKSTTQVWVVTRYQHGISAGVPRTLFRGDLVASRNVGCFLGLSWSKWTPWATSLRPSKLSAEVWREGRTLMGLSNFRATSLAFERLLRRNDERVAYSIVVSLMYSLWTGSLFGEKNGKEREKACSQATNVKILRGGSRRGARGGPGPLLFLDQTEGRRAEKNFFGRPGPFFI